MTISESLLEHRKKITATLVWCAELERKYINGETKCPPHLLNVGVGDAVWYTLEISPLSPQGVIQGWDIKFNKFRSIPYEQVIDVEINSLSYEPVRTEEEWRERQAWTNLQYNPEMQIRQSKGRFS